MWGSLHRSMLSKETNAICRFRKWFLSCKIEQTEVTHSFTLSADESVSIKNVNADNAPDATIYNLNGQRMKKPAKGLYIISGRKHAVR